MGIRGRGKGIFLSPYYFNNSPNHDVNIHVSFRYIDQGKNPQLYTKDCMEKALAKNEAVKGKIDALRVTAFFSDF